MSNTLLDDASPAFLSRESYAEFSFIYQMSLIGSGGLLGLCFIMTLVVVALRRFVCFDAEEEELKPLTLKVQDRVDAAHWSIKNGLQLLVGLVVFGLSAFACDAPIVTFPDGNTFNFVGRCRGDVCQKWNPSFVQVCGFSTQEFFGPDTTPSIALFCAGAGGGLYVFILLIELSRRCCPDLCLGVDPESDHGNPSKGYFARWILLLLRLFAFGAHTAGCTYMNWYIWAPRRVCVNGYAEWQRMMTSSASFGIGFYCLCVAIVVEVIDIWLDGVLGEVGRLVLEVEPEDEIALQDVFPQTKTVLPITIENTVSKIDNGSMAGLSGSLALSQISSPPPNGAMDDEAKKLIQQQQIALDNMKREMLAQQQQFTLTLQQQQQQPSSPSFQVLAPSSPSSSALFLPSAEPQQNSAVDSEKQKQLELLQQEKDRQHNQELAEHQNQILALQQLVQQLQLQNSVSFPPSPQKQAIDDQTILQFTNDSIFLQPVITQQKQNQNNNKNPLSFASQVGNNDDDNVYCDDMGCAEPEATEIKNNVIGNDDKEKTGKKKKKDKSSKSIRKQNDPATDAATASRREKFDAQQRIIHQLQDEQQALIATLQVAVENNQNNNNNNNKNHGK